MSRDVIYLACVETGSEINGPPRAPSFLGITVWTSRTQQQQLILAIVTTHNLRPGRLEHSSLSFSLCSAKAGEKELPTDLSRASQPGFIMTKLKLISSASTSGPSKSTKSTPFTWEPPLPLHPSSPTAIDLEAKSALSPPFHPLPSSSMDTFGSRPIDDWTGSTEGGKGKGLVRCRVSNGGCGNGRVVSFRVKDNCSYGVSWRY